MLYGSKPDLTNGSSFVPHAFVDADKVYQYLPWDYKAWFQGEDTTNICILVSNDEGNAQDIKERRDELVAYLSATYSIEVDSDQGFLLEASEEVNGEDD